MPGCGTIKTGVTGSRTRRGYRQGRPRKRAIAGLASGGGKMIALPEIVTLDDARRADVLHDAGDLIESLGARYAAGPDVGTMDGQPASRLISGEGPAGRFA
jgi:hypothetical protein